MNQGISDKLEDLPVDNTLIDSLETTLENPGLNIPNPGKNPR
jgi:hypothetical protein